MPVAEAALPLLKSLMEINSINPSLVPGGPGEDEIARFIADWLDKRGIETQLIEAAPGRTSVVGKVSGKGGGKSLILNGHIDIVGVTGMERPFEPDLRDGKLYGRGGFDMKGGVAACIMALLDMRDAGLAGDVYFAGVADEEHSSIGVQEVLKHIHADGAIVTEPTALDVCIAHKGFHWEEIVVTGNAAHGSQAHLGIDAIAKMGHVLVAIEEYQRELASRTPYPLLGHGSVHASLIEGGQELSSYPEKCVLGVERRTLPTETEASVSAEFAAILDRIAKADPQFKATHRTTLVRNAFGVSEEAPLVKTLLREAEGIIGRRPAITSQNPWMDSAFFQAAGIETVVFGPTGEGAHAKVEWVDVESVEKCRLALAATARSFCG